jgi:hypothetical protein
MPALPRARRTLEPANDNGTIYRLQSQNGRSYLQLKQPLFASIRDARWKRIGDDRMTAEWRIAAACVQRRRVRAPPPAAKDALAGSTAATAPRSRYRSHGRACMNATGHGRFTIRKQAGRASGLEGKDYRRADHRGEWRRRRISLRCKQVWHGREWRNAQAGLSRGRTYARAVARFPYSTREASPIRVIQRIITNQSVSLAPART